MRFSGTFLIFFRLRVDRLSRGGFLPLRIPLTTLRPGEGIKIYPCLRHYFLPRNPLRQRQQVH